MNKNINKYTIMSKFLKVNEVDKEYMNLKIEQIMNDRNNMNKEIRKSS